MPAVPGVKLDQDEEPEGAAGTTRMTEDKTPSGSGSAGTCLGDFNRLISIRIKHRSDSKITPVWDVPREAVPAEYLGWGGCGS